MLPVFLLAVFSLDVGWIIFLFFLLCEILNHRRDSWALGFQYILLISPIRCLLGEAACMLWAQGQLHGTASYRLLAGEMTQENQSMRRSGDVPWGRYRGSRPVPVASAWTAVAKYPTGWVTQHWGPEVWDQGAGQVGFFSLPDLQMAVSSLCLHRVLTRYLSGICILISSSDKDTGPIGLGLTHMISLYLNYLPIQSLSEVRGFRTST